MQIEYTEKMIVENTDVEEVRYNEEDMLKLGFKLDESILDVINLIGEDKFNELLHEERIDSYIENEYLVDYFLDKNNDFDDTIKFILMSDAMNAVNKVISYTIFDDVEFTESDEDKVKLYHEFGDIDILEGISKIAAGFILSSQHVAYDIEEVAGKNYFVLTVDTESLEESLSTL